MGERMSGRAARVVVLACALAWSECFPVVGSRQGVAPSVHLCVAPYRSLPAERLRGGGGQDAGAGGGQAQTSHGEEAALAADEPEYVPGAMQQEPSLDSTMLTAEPSRSAARAPLLSAAVRRVKPRHRGCAKRADVLLAGPGRPRALLQGVAAAVGLEPLA